MIGVVALCAVGLLFALSLFESLLGPTVKERLPKATRWLGLAAIVAIKALVAPDGVTLIPEGVAVAAVAIILLSGLRPGLLLITGWWAEGPTRPPRLRIRAEIARWGTLLVVLVWAGVRVV